MDDFSIEIFAIQLQGKKRSVRFCVRLVCTVPFYLYMHLYIEVPPPSPPGTRVPRCYSLIVAAFMS